MNHGSVLIVEDEKDLRDVYSLILKHAGYEVTEAANGQEALNGMSVPPPDLILLDIFMPVLDGKGFLEHFDTAKHPGTNVIVCSNTADKALMAEMINLGAKQVVTKATLAPSDLTTLVAPYFTD